MSDDAYPGEEFVATISCEARPDFFDRLDRFVSDLKKRGYSARCPGTSVFAGVLVPKCEAVSARSYLSSIRVDYLYVWIADQREAQHTYIGA
jgi:hypothetical protein